MKNRIWFELDSEGNIIKHCIDCNRNSTDCGEHTEEIINLEEHLSAELARFIEDKLTSFTYFESCINQIKKITETVGLIF
jgi:hypothetical protein